jgi:hypothetical protein
MRAVDARIDALVWWLGCNDGAEEAVDAFVEAVASFGGSRDERDDTTARRRLVGIKEALVLLRGAVRLVYDEAVACFCRGCCLWEALPLAFARGLLLVADSLVVGRLISSNDRDKG